jgi:hypothetical protein
VLPPCLKLMMLTAVMVARLSPSKLFIVVPTAQCAESPCCSCCAAVPMRFRLQLTCSAGHEGQQDEGSPSFVDWWIAHIVKGFQRHMRRKGFMRATLGLLLTSGNVLLDKERCRPRRLRGIYVQTCASGFVLMTRRRIFVASIICMLMAHWRVPRSCVRSWGFSMTLQRRATECSDNGQSHVIHGKLGSELVPVKNQKISLVGMGRIKGNIQGQGDGGLWC